MPRKKILIATGLYPPEIGGPATYTKILEQELPKRGVGVSVLPFSSVRFLPKIIRHLAYFFLVLFRSIRADIIYAQDSVSVGFPAVLASFFTGKRFFLRVGGDYAWEQSVQRFGFTGTLDEFVAKKQKSLFVRFLQSIQSFVARRAEKVIAPSQYLKSIVRTWGVKEGSVSVIESVFSDTNISESKQDAREALRLRGRVIVSVGRLVPWKGFDGLIVSFQEVYRHFPDSSLVIIGSGPEEGRLKSFASGGGGGKIVFTGALPQKEVLRYLRAADIFVLNTGYEGFSHQILEAMSIGVPVITTSVGGNLELIRHEENGVLVPFRDTKALTREMINLLQDDIFAKQLSDKAKKTLENFSKEKMVKSLINELQ